MQVVFHRTRRRSLKLHGPYQEIRQLAETKITFNDTFEAALRLQYSAEACRLKIGAASP